MFLGIPCQYLLLIFAMALSLFPKTAYAAKKKVKLNKKSVIVNVGKTVKKKSPKKTPKPTPVVTPTPKPTKKPLQSMQPTNQTPATAHQVRQLKELMTEYGIADVISWDNLTRSQASRLYDEYRSTYINRCVDGSE